MKKAVVVHSYGIMPIKKENGRWSVLLTQHYEGHWGFPKGRPEGDESPYETAARELSEETGLDVGELLQERPLEERYSFVKEGKRYEKTVTYYIATVEGDVRLQEEEIIDSIWVLVEDAKEYITFFEGKKLCIALEEYCMTL